MSMALTAVARFPTRSPEPCVPVAIAPPTEMCGRDARLCSASPCSCSTGASRPYVIDGFTSTVAVGDVDDYLVRELHRG